ncbi:MAG: hypothetical protein IT373_31830 [Polyangiaceae bacterium]|nr:hypothetical protein [Polyangiaceae bacterium]
MYYYKYLVRAFAYLDLVFVDTPIRDKNLANSLARQAQAASDDFGARFDRVRGFLEYMDREDAEEIRLSADRSGPYVECVIPDIRAQIEQEIEVIIDRKNGLARGAPVPIRRRRRRRRSQR